MVADAMAGYISIPKPFASGDATEWFKLFEICSFVLKKTAIEMTLSRVLVCIILMTVV